MTTGPGFVVDAVPLAPPRVSLLSSADVTTNGDRWQAGLAWRPEACEPPTNPYWWTCADTGGAAPATTKVSQDPEAVVRYRPVDVWVGVKCGNMAAGDEFEREARRALEAFQSFLIERELWTGAIATLASFDNDFLMNAPTAINGAALTPYVTALGELEQALATCQPGQVGMIHAQPRTVTTWIQNGLVTPEPNGRRLRTALGTIVVPGAGYPGTGTGLAAATKDASFAYGTGLVRVFLGPVEVFPDFERSQNTQIVRAERAVAAVMDECCLVSVQVDLNVAL